MSGDQAKRVRRVQSGVVNGMSGGLRVVGSMTSTMELERWSSEKVIGCVLCDCVCNLASIN